MASRRLSTAQRRHLAELVAVADGNHGEAYWYPVGSGEQRCAHVLYRRGFLRHESGTGHPTYSLTDAGKAAVNA